MKIVGPSHRQDKTYLLLSKRGSLLGSRSVEKGRRLLPIGKELIFAVCQIGFAEGTSRCDQDALGKDAFGSD